MNPTINKILFTTDLSVGSREVFKMAVSLANSCNASITLLHVIEEMSLGKKGILENYIGKDIYDKINDENKKHAQNVLIGKQKEVPIIREALMKMSQEDSTNDNGDAVKIDEILVTTGRPIDEILIRSEKLNCDVIVMGHHHHSIIVETMIGGTARGVMRRSKIPVFLVPIEE